MARLATALSATPGAVQAFVSVTCAGRDVTEVEQLAALKALQARPMSPAWQIKFQAGRGLGVRSPHASVTAHAEKSALCTGSAGL